MLSHALPCLQTLTEVLPPCGGCSEVPHLPQTWGTVHHAFPLWGLVVAAALSPLPAQCQRPGSPPSLSPVLDLSLWQHKCVTDSGDLVVTPRRDAGLQVGTGSVAFGHLSRTWSQGPVRGQGCPAALLSITQTLWRAGQLCLAIRGAVLKRLLSVTLVITPVQSFFIFSFNYFSLSSLTLLFPP